LTIANLLPTCSPNLLPTCLPTYLPTYLPAYYPPTTSLVLSYYLPTTYTLPTHLPTTHPLLTCYLPTSYITTYEARTSYLPSTTYLLITYYLTSTYIFTTCYLRTTIILLTTMLSPPIYYYYLVPKHYLNYYLPLIASTIYTTNYYLLATFRCPSLLQSTTSYLYYAPLTTPHTPPTYQYQRTTPTAAYAPPTNYLRTS
jgi:hypothetical protein